MLDFEHALITRPLRTDVFLTEVITSIAWCTVTRLAPEYLHGTIVGPLVYPGHGDDTTIGAEKPHLPVWRERGW